MVLAISMIRALNLRSFSPSARKSNTSSNGAVDLGRGFEASGHRATSIAIPRPPPDAPRGTAAPTRRARARALAVGVAGLLRASEPSQEICPRRVEVVVAVQLQMLDELERVLRPAAPRRLRRPGSARPPGSRSARRARSYRAAIWGQSGGSPVCRAAIAACSTYGPRPPSAIARSSTARPSSIWAASHSDRSWSASSTSSAVAESRVAPRVVQEHQGEQPVRLGLVGHQLGQCASEPNRLAGEVASPAVALVEDQVDDGQHRRQPVRKQMVGRDAKGDAGGLDLALGPHEPLGHGRLRNDEGARDLSRRQSGERAQGERHLSVEAERGMTAGEDQLQSLIRESTRRSPRPPCGQALRAASSSRPASCRGESGRSPGCAPW